MSRRVLEFKTERGPFGRIWEGRKRAEWRDLSGREVMVGDTLRLREIDEAGRFSGREVYAVVTDVEASPRYGIPAGFAMLSIDVRRREPRGATRRAHLAECERGGAGLSTLPWEAPRTPTTSIRAAAAALAADPHGWMCLHDSAHECPATAGGECDARVPYLELARELREIADREATDVIDDPATGEAIAPARGLGGEG